MDFTNCDYLRVEFEDRPPCYMRHPQGQDLYLPALGAVFAVKVDEAEYLRNTTLIDQWIKPGWAPPSQPYVDLIAAEYEKLHGGPPGDTSSFDQLKSIFEAFDEYRAHFGEWDDVRCENCQNFFDEGTPCLYCEADDDE